MQLPSLVIGLLYVLAFAGIEAATSYFVTGEGASYVFATVITAILAAAGRYLQEQKALRDATTVSNDGMIMRSARVTETKKSPTQEALFG